MSLNLLSTDKFASWTIAAEYLDNNPDIHSYNIGSCGSIGYLLIRTNLKGVYHQLKYEGSKLVSSVLMDTAKETINIHIDR